MKLLVMQAFGNSYTWFGLPLQLCALGPKMAPIGSALQLMAWQCIARSDSNSSNIVSEALVCNGGACSAGGVH